jgi:GNAT superfamily N-acetyltransferase
MKKSWFPEIAQERYFRAAATLAGIPVYEKDGLSWIMGEKPGYPRAIFRTMLRRRDLPRRVPEIAARMRAGELPGLWSGNAYSRPRVLEKYLLCHGFHMTWPAAGMVLKRLSPRPAIQTDYTVQPLTEDAWIPAWSRIVNTELFKGDEKAAQGFTDLIRSIWQDERMRLFAAVRDGQLLGTVISYIEDGLAWIGYVAVSLDARRQGIGSRLTWQAARWAKECGADTVALHASVLGEPVYAKLGFEVVSRIKRLRLVK